MSAEYIGVEWIHEFRDEPRAIYLELDAERYEARKIEVFKDGSVTKVSRDKPESGSTLLSSYPTPSLEEINASEEFHGREISAAEFEDLWKSAG